MYVQPSLNALSYAPVEQGNTINKTKIGMAHCAYFCFFSMDGGDRGGVNYMFWGALSIDREVNDALDTTRCIYA